MEINFVKTRLQMTNTGIYAREIRMKLVPGFSPLYSYLGLKPGFWFIIISPT